MAECVGKWWIESNRSISSRTKADKPSIDPAHVRSVRPQEDPNRRRQRQHDSRSLRMRITRRSVSSETPSVSRTRSPLSSTSPALVRFVDDGAVELGSWSSFHPFRSLVVRSERRMYS